MDWLIRIALTLAALLTWFGLVRPGLRASRQGRIGAPLEPVAFPPKGGFHGERLS